MSLFGRRNTHDKFVAVVFVIVVACLIVAGVWAWRQWRSYTPEIDHNRYPVSGIDVSAHNGEIDFAAVKKSGVDFVFIKASEGETFRDKKFADNYERAMESGLVVGAYHYFRFDNEGVMQAMNLCQALGDRRPPLGVAIDIEFENNASITNPMEIVENLSAMLDYLKLKGLPIVLYSNKEGYYEFIADYFSDYPLWICSFSDTPIEADWTFWQYSHSGKVPGVNGKVDLDIFCGPRDKWDEYIASVAG